MVESNSDLAKIGKDILTKEWKDIYYAQKRDMTKVSTEGCLLDNDYIENNAM